MNSKKFSLVVTKPIKDFKKNISVDSDKSISIRSFLIGSISLMMVAAISSLASNLFPSFVWGVIQVAYPNLLS